MKLYEKRASALMTAPTPVDSLPQLMEKQLHLSRVTQIILLLKASYAVK